MSRVITVTPDELDKTATDIRGLADGYKTLYANLDNVPDLNEGENVTKGQIIGYIGNSASFESMDACHLHFEALKGDVKINPLDLFKTEE